MTTSKVSPEDRLERKRKAARLRQQRCRSRKRNNVLMMMKENLIGQEQQVSSPLVMANTPPYEVVDSNHYNRETISTRPSVSYKSQWQPYWRVNSTHRQEEVPPVNFKHPCEYPVRKRTHHPVSTSHACEPPLRAYQSFVYEQRCPSYDLSPPFMREEYGSERLPLYQKPPLLPVLSPYKHRTCQDYQERCENEESRVSPDHHSSGRGSFDNREEAAIDAILSLKDSFPGPQPEKNEGSATITCHHLRSSFRPYHRPTPLRYYQKTSYHDHQTHMKPGFYLRFK